MFSTTHYDVLVVGARCAGASVAMLLARSGLRVLAIDRAPYGTDTLSTHALMRGGVLQLHRWGVLPAILRADTPSVRQTAFHYGDDVVAVDIRPMHGVSALYAPRRTLLDATLVDAARAAGADIRHGLGLVDLIRRHDGRVIGASLQDRHGGVHTIGAGMVIGADGIGSTVARLVEAPDILRANHACAVVFGYVPNLRLAGYHWYFRPGVSAGMIPTNGGQYCVFVAMPPARFRAAMGQNISAGFRAALAEVDPGLAHEMPPMQAERLISFPGRKGFMRRPYGPGWALIGDAGYFKDPLTAHGITDALRDAELLARAIVEDTTAAMTGFAEARDTLSWPLFHTSDAIASFNWDLASIRQHHHALNVAMKRETTWLAELAPFAQPGGGVSVTMLQQEIVA